jgi:hypothetical protein
MLANTTRERVAMDRIDFILKNTNEGMNKL